MTNRQVPNSNSSTESIILHERLRQARLSFNLALTATATSFLIGLAGAGLFLSGKVPSGTITSAAGLVTSVRCLKFAKEVNDHLDNLLEEEK